MKGLREKLSTIGDNVNNKDFLEKFGIIKSQKNGLAFLNYSGWIEPNKFSNLCRGTIFRDNKLALLPLTRFFNLREPYATIIDWRYANVLEKLDGTLISVWYDTKENRWRICSRRMIDKISIQQFHECKMLNLAIIFKKFFPSYKDMDKSYWYVFELVYSRIITYYPENKYGLYLLTVRNRRSLSELSQNRVRDIARNINEPMVKLPELYDLRSEEAILRMFEGKPKDFEGIVVIDNNFNRIKIKQKSYLKLHYFINRISSLDKMIDIILDNEQNEFLSYFPDLKDKFDEIEKKLNMLKKETMTVFGMYNHIQSRKEFAIAIKNLPYRHLLFKLKDGYKLEYLFQYLGGKRLEKFLKIE